MDVDLSVIVPVYNRGALARFTLESVQRATGNLRVETIVIDDGSDSPLDEALAGFPLGPFKVYRQENRGLLFARLAGLERATGRYVLFLDSDDLVHPEKFVRQLAAMEESNADVSYSDEAAVPLDETWPNASLERHRPRAATDNSVEFFVHIQPAPHNPIFRTAFLRSRVEAAWMPPSSLFNPVAELWFYYLCAGSTGGRVVKVDGPLTLQGLHPGERLSNSWEKLSIGSVAVMLAFVRHCSVSHETEAARRAVAQRAFLAFRALPHDAPEEIDRRLMHVFYHLPRPATKSLGGVSFRVLAGLIGLERAARLLRRRQRPSYNEIRTLAPGEFARRGAELPTL